MKKYIVSQCFRCYYKPEDKNADLYAGENFSKDVQVGEYTESEFIGLVGERFFKSNNFKKYTESGFLKIVNEQDITEKTAKKYNSLD